MSKKIKYLGDDTIRLAQGPGMPLIINKGEIHEFPDELANAFLRQTEVEVVGYEDKEKTKPKVKEVHKWEEIPEKGGK